MVDVLARVVGLVAKLAPVALCLGFYVSICLVMDWFDRREK